MIFSGLPFLLGFLPIFLAGCAVCGRLGGVWMKSWLIAASLLFYGIGATRFLPLLIVSVCGNYVALWLMQRSDRRTRWALVGVAANLGALCWFKFVAPDAPLPLGISFFTFTQIGCLLHHADPGVAPPKVRDYALFAVFFPALIAGPVLNAREMLPQFARTSGWRSSADDVAVGFGFFLIGLLKKTLLADPVAPIVAAGFADPGSLTVFPAWQVACGYSLQLYFDFSGYTDMAIGLAWMVGLRFPENFEQPYRARSVIAYWQRWHMSLTRFLMTNVHAPLTLAAMRWRKRRGQPVDTAGQRSAVGFGAMIAAPILVTMMLVALWHGDRATFLVFGLLHTAFLLVNHAWRLLRGPALPALASVGITYFCVLVGAVVFRAGSIPDAVAVFAGMTGAHGLGAPGADVRAVADGLWLLALYAIVWFAPTTRQIMLSRGRLGWRASPSWAVAMGGAATLGVLAAGGTGEFLYFRF